MTFPCRLLAPLALLCAGPASAGTLYQVGPTKPFANLQAVASLLTPGDVVEIDGNVTYPGGVLLQEHGTAARLASEGAAYVTGATLVVEGGWTAQ